MENHYLPIVGSFLKDNPNLYKDSTPLQKVEIAKNLAKDIQGLVQYLTPLIAQQEITETMDEATREAITNMARLRAEETAFSQILYETVEAY